MGAFGVFAEELKNMANQVKGRKNPMSLRVTLPLSGDEEGTNACSA